MSQACPFPNSVGLTVSNMSQSLAFYCDQLGFKLNERWPSEGDVMWASLDLDGQVFMFGQAMSSADCQKTMAPNPAAAKFWSRYMDAFATGVHGAGVNLYVMVPDVDAYAAQLAERGVEPALPPTSQFYGLRDIVVVDPNGYTLTFYTPIKMDSCQSCGMPLADAKPGQMYCSYCTDEKGVLRPYEQIFEGTVQGYFVAQMKLARSDAEKAARKHLATMPAWAARG